MKHSISGASNSSLESWYRYASMICIFIALPFNYITATDADQCTNPVLVCNNQINLSIPDGTITIEPILISEGIPTACLADYQVSIQHNGIAIGNQISCTFSGKLLDFTLTHQPSGLSCSGTIFIEDKSGPIITCVNQDIECSTDISPSSIGEPIVFDNCDTNSSLTFFDTYVDFNCTNTNFLGSIQRQWIATDSEGNSSICTQQINVIRPSLTGITLPADITIECSDGSSEPSNTGSPMIASLPSGVSCNFVIDFEDSTTPVCAGASKIIRRWTIIDWCTNQQIDHTQLISIEDNFGPIITCPGTLTFGANEATCDATVTLPIIDAVEECGTLASITASWEFGIGFGPFNNIPIGEYVINYIAEDDCGNTSICSTPIVILDDIIPVAVCDLTTSVGIGESQLSMICADDIDSGSYDNCELVSKEIRLVGDTEYSECISITCDQVGSTLMVELQVTDHVDLQNHCIVEVSVFDKTPPTITNCAADITINCDDNPNDLNITGSPVAIDNCSTAIIFTDVVDLNQCNIGEIIRTFVVTDNSENSASCTQTITLVDNTAPVITFSEDLTLVCQSINDEIGKPTAVDNCGQFAFFFEDVILIDEPCIQEFDRKWEVLNICTGVTVSENLKITLLNDDNLPVFSDAPLEITISCSDPIPDFIAPTVTDLCDMDVQIETNTSEETNDCPSIRSIIRTYIATDDCGNSSAFSQTIRLIDNNAPTFTNFPADQTINCDELPTNNSPGAIDNCDENPTVFFTDQTMEGDCPEIEIITRTFIARDRCGNSSSETQIFTLVDTKAPIIRGLTNDFTVSCQFPIPVFDLGAIDNCDEELDIEIIDNSIAGDCPNEEVITRINSVTDDCGNEVLDTIIITVVDNSAPQLTATNLVANLIISCDQVDPIINFNVTDNCDSDLEVVETRDTVGNPCFFEVLRTFSVTDDCGNESILTQNLTVLDNQAPNFSVFPQNQDVTIFNGESIQVDVVDAIVIDNCFEDLDVRFVIDFFSDGDQAAAPNETVNGNNASGIYPLGTHTITFSSEDACGNAIEQDLLISVFDFVPSSVCNSITLEIGENGLLSVDPVSILEDPSILNAAGLTINFVDPSNFTQVIGPSLLLDCDNLGLNQYAIEINDPDGNTSVCSNMIVLIDPDGRCGMRPDEASVAGKIFNLNGAAVSDVNVQLQYDNNFHTDTDQFGIYQFDALPIGASCEIVPEHDQNHSLGVSSFDMVLIQMHILQVNKFTSPYQHIAADVNQSGRIDIQDLLEIRSLILFQAEEFSASPSYRFMDAKHQFENPDNPLSEYIPSTHICQNIEDTQVDLDFISIKIGDIDGSSYQNLDKQNITTRSESFFTIGFEDALLPANQISTIEINGNSLAPFSALQFGLNLRDTELINVDYPNELRDNINIQKSEIHFAWTTFDDDLPKTLFKISLRPNQDISVSDILHFHLQEKAISFDDSGHATRIDLKPISSTSTPIGNFLGQNNPNPFANNTDIPFYLEQEGATTIQIKNLEGKTVHTHTSNYPKGWHTYQYASNDIASGIYFYSLIQNSTTQIKKMLITR